MPRSNPRLNNRESSCRREFSLSARRAIYTAYEFSGSIAAIARYFNILKLIVVYTIKINNERENY